MATTALRRDEGVGLALAVAAHVALVAFLVWRPLGKPVLPPPERVTVTISDEVGLTSTSPEPAAQAAPDAGPEIGEPAPEPIAEPAPPQPIVKPEPPRPQPKPEPPKPAPAPRAAPPPKPVARPAPARPAPRAAPAPPPKPTPKPAQARARPHAQPAARPAPARPTASAPRNAGASSFAAAFKAGVPGAQTASGQSRNPPAAAIGPAVRSSLAGAISRQLKPRWAAPQGADADKLVTILSWSLNRDGSLAGRPAVVRQEGITDANRAQADRHAEQAIRAVQLAAPFELPDEFYDAWKRVSSFRFDRKLSQ